MSHSVLWETLIPWYGFVMAYDAGTLAQVAVLNTSPSLISGGSIWGGGQGPVADSAGNVYVITANGDFNANTGGHDYSTSFLKLDGSSLSVHGLLHARQPVLPRQLRLRR